MSEIFDKLLTSRPVDSAAARVLGRGVHYVPQKNIAQRHWKSPPPVIPQSDWPKTDSFHDLTGLSFGRFKVVGYLGKPGSKKQLALWLVRCACGDFESRSAKAVRNPENRGDRCGNCRHLAFLKRQEAYLRNPAAPQPDVRDL